MGKYYYKGPLESSFTTVKSNYRWTFTQRYGPLRWSFYIRFYTRDKDPLESAQTPMQKALQRHFL